MAPTLPPLEHGDRLTRSEFERRYDAMPNMKKAELIEGVVYIPSRARLGRTASPRFRMIGLLGVYAAYTPGIDGGAHSSVRLDLDNMPQPDAVLILDHEQGGQTRIGEDDYIEGAPELVAEVTLSGASYDLHAKLHVYRRSGVREYVVWRVLDRAIDWLILRDGRYEPLPLDADGIYRSAVFPGLWIDPNALIVDDGAGMMRAVQAGLASPEHAAFVARLAQAVRPAT